VAVVDEYPSQVDGVAHAIDQSSSMQTVLMAASGAEAADRLEGAHPDVVLVEPWMRSGDGIAFISRLNLEHPEIPVIALSRLWDEQHVAESRAAGAVAHLPKTIDLDDLPALVRQVLAGIELHPPVQSGAALRSPLTAREREVLRLAAKGLSNAEIAQELFVTEQTVKFHLSNTYRKLGAHNRTEASHRAAQAGILG
jgi:DNA-binding NarL/FixJ family response regulator